MYIKEEEYEEVILPPSHYSLNNRGEGINSKTRCAEAPRYNSANFPFEGSGAHTYVIGCGGELFYWFYSENNSETFISCKTQGCKDDWDSSPMYGLLNEKLSNYDKSFVSLCIGSKAQYDKSLSVLNKCVVDSSGYYLHSYCWTSTYAGYDDQYKWNSNGSDHEGYKRA